MWGWQDRQLQLRMAQAQAADIEAAREQQANQARELEEQRLQQMAQSKQEEITVAAVLIAGNVETSIS